LADEIREEAPRPLAGRRRASNRTRFDTGRDTRRDTGRSIKTGDETRNSDETTAAKMRAADGNAG